MTKEIIELENPCTCGSNKFVYWGGVHALHGVEVKYKCTMCDKIIKNGISKS